MSDYNSSNPVRTESPGDLIVKIADATLPSQQLAVEPDGSINVNASISATDLDIRDLQFAQDSVDVSGSSVTVSATDLDVRDLAFASDKVDVSGSAVSVSATDLDIRNLSAAQDSVAAHLKDESGNPFTAANPLPVAIVDYEGTEVNDYNTSAGLNPTSSSNHDYTAAGAFKLRSINASASGKMKIEVQIETASGSGTFVTKFVAFNSTANPNMSIDIKDAISVVSGAKVRIIRKNLDNQPMDVYSTSSGFLV